MKVLKNMHNKAQRDIRKRVLKQNIKYIWKFWLKLVGVFASVFSVITLFVTWEDIGIDGIFWKIMVLTIVCIVLMACSVVWTCVCRKQKVIWECPSGRIIVRYADILEEAFQTKCEQERLYVIPVNSTFDTIVDTDISLCDKPLISPYSLHGRWLMKMAENGIETGKIDEAVRDCLRKRKVKYETLPEEKKAAGKREIYPLGTVAMVKGTGNTTFLLLALTNFDENNNAHVSPKGMQRAIRSLIKFYDRYGQGHELTIPLMGTNFSRTGLTHEDSLRIITSMLRIYGASIRGDVSVAVYVGDKDKVTIDI